MCYIDCVVVFIFFIKSLLSYFKKTVNSDDNSDRARIPTILSVGSAKHEIAVDSDGQFVSDSRDSEWKTPETRIIQSRETDSDKILQSPND
eukprot:UN05016